MRRVRFSADECSDIRDPNATQHAVSSLWQGPSTSRPRLRGTTPCVLIERTPLAHASLRFNVIIEQIERQSRIIAEPVRISELLVIGIE